SRFEESVCRRAHLRFRRLAATDRATGQRRPFVTPGDRSPQDAQQRKISMTRQSPWPAARTARGCRSGALSSRLRPGTPGGTRRRRKLLRRRLTCDTAPMDLPLGNRLHLGVQTIHRRTEPGVGPWRPEIDELSKLVELVDRSGYDSLWVGDHVAFALPILDPFLQLAQAAVVSRRLQLGTAVYLLPLRSPAPVAKQVATLDHLTEGRFVFGVGVGGEFPREYEVCGVPMAERGARLTESLLVLRKLWTGNPVSHDRRFFKVDPGARRTPPRPGARAGRSGPVAVPMRP